MRVLQINASIKSEGSESTALADAIVTALRAAHPELELTRHELSRHPLPELDEAALVALMTEAGKRSPAQAARVAQDDARIAEIQAAEVLVLGVPMYNFGIPAQLKNWIDAICRARVTFQYTAHGAEGLLTGKKVYVALSRGGLYRDTAADTVVPYLRAVLGFVGLSDVQFVYAEGLAMGPDAATQARAAADHEIAALAF